MKDIDKKKQFIELRAKNWSFKRISNEIGVSKSTLIKWSKEFKYEVENLYNMELESLYEQYKTSKHQKLEYLGELHEKILLELNRRDLKDIKSDKLLEMLIKTTDKLEETKGDHKFYFRTPEDINSQKKSDERLKLFELI